MTTCSLPIGRLLAGCSSTPKVPEGEFPIQGELMGVPDSMVILLLKEDGNLLTTIQKDTVVNGKFFFQDVISGATPKKLFLLSNDKGFPGMQLNVWIQSGKYIHIIGNDRLLSLWNVSSDIPQQKASNDPMALCSSERKRIMQRTAQEYDLFRLEKKQGLNWKKIDSLRALRNPLDSLVYMAGLNCMKKAPVTPIWLDRCQLFCSFLQYNQKFGNQDLIRSLYTRVFEADKQAEAGQLVTAYSSLPEEVNMGDEMVDGDLYDLDGNVRHLTEFKGKYILLDF